MSLVITDKKKNNLRHNFVCETCHFTCTKRSDYNRHIMTRKHKIRTNTYQNNIQKYHMCLCGKKYKHRQSLFTHKKTCTSFESSLDEEGMEGDSGNDDDTYSNILVNDRNVGDGFSNEMKHVFFGVMQQNKEMLQTIITQQQQLSELIRNGV